MSTPLEIRINTKIRVYYRHKLMFKKSDSVEIEIEIKQLIIEQLGRI